jgi:hypothetical protein
MALLTFALVALGFPVENHIKPKSGGDYPPPLVGLFWPTLIPEISAIFGTTLCDSTFFPFACRFVFSRIETTPFCELVRSLKITVISNLRQCDR